MTRTLFGTVHGKTIELEQELGVADGQQVELQVTIPIAHEPWGEAIKRTAGALTDDADWDPIMQELHDARKLLRPTSANQVSRFRPIPIRGVPLSETVREERR